MVLVSTQLKLQTQTLPVVLVPLDWELQKLFIVAVEVEGLKNTVV